MKQHPNGQGWLKANAKYVDTFDTRDDFKLHEAWLDKLAMQNGKNIAYAVVPFPGRYGTVQKWQVFIW